MSQHDPEWLNVELMEKVLRRSEHDDSIVVTNLTTKPAIDKGDNFTSDIFRVGVEYLRRIDGREVTENVSLITKISPTEDGIRKNMVDEVGPFDTEIRMMSTTLAEMNEMLLSEENCRLSPRVFYAEKGDPSIIVIEDLLPLGFRMCSREAGLDLRHCRLVMRGLAKFHATSVAIVEKKPQLMKEYQKGLYHQDHPDPIKMFAAKATKALAKEIHNWPELGPSYAEKIEKLASVTYAKAIECMRPRYDEFEVINHGDCWLNNMLFRYDEDGKPVGHIFVDFQFCVWGSPAIDILFFLHTSATYDVVANHRAAIIEEYLDTLRETMSRFGCKTQPPSIAALEKIIRDREYFGVHLACTLLPVLLADKKESKSMDELLGGTDSPVNPTINGPIYRDRIIRLLPDWNNQGLLDV